MYFIWKGLTIKTIKCFVANTLKHDNELQLYISLRFKVFTPSLCGLFDLLSEMKIIWFQARSSTEPVLKIKARIIFLNVNKVSLLHMQNRDRTSCNKPVTSLLQVAVTSGMRSLGLVNRSNCYYVVTVSPSSLFNARFGSWLRSFKLRSQCLNLAANVVTNL